MNLRPRVLRDGDCPTRADGLSAGPPRSTASRRPSWSSFGFQGRGAVPADPGDEAGRPPGGGRNCCMTRAAFRRRAGGPRARRPESARPAAGGATGACPGKAELTLAKLWPGGPCRRRTREREERSSSSRRKSPPARHAALGGWGRNVQGRRTRRRLGPRPDGRRQDGMNPEKAAALNWLTTPCWVPQGIRTSADPPRAGGRVYGPARRPFGEYGSRFS